jgi:hypothetical protein
MLPQRAAGDRAGSTLFLCLVGGCAMCAQGACRAPTYATIRTAGW